MTNPFELDPALLAEYDQDMAYADQAVEGHMAMLRLVKLLPGAPTEEAVMMGLLVKGTTAAIAEAEKLGTISQSNLPLIYARLIYRLYQETNK